MALLIVLLLQAPATSFWPPRDDTTASFPHYPHRDVYSLDGVWDFEFVNYTAYNANSSTLPTLSFNAIQNVPSAWDARYGTGLQYTRGAVGLFLAALFLPAFSPVFIAPSSF